MIAIIIGVLNEWDAERSTTIIINSQITAYWDSTWGTTAKTKGNSGTTINKYKLLAKYVFTGKTFLSAWNFRWKQRKGASIHSNFFHDFDCSYLYRRWRSKSNRAHDLFNWLIPSYREIFVCTQKREEKGNEANLKCFIKLKKNTWKTFWWKKVINIGRQIT